MAAPPTQTIYSQTPVQPPSSSSGEGGGISAESYKTADELVRMLKEIHTEAMRSGLADRSKYKGTQEEYMKAIEEHHSRMYERYKMFAQELPLVFRWASSNFKMSEKAFRYYLKHHHRGMWKNPEHKVKTQSEYIVAAWKESHPNASTASIDRFRKSVVKNVVDEQKRFEEAGKEAKKIVKQNDRNRRQILLENIFESLGRPVPEKYMNNSEDEDEGEEGGK